MQIEIRQQWRDHAALGRATPVALAAPVTTPALFSRFHHRRLEPLLDQGQYRPVGNTLGDDRHKLGVRNRIEVLGQIRVDHMGMPTEQRLGHGIARIMGRALRAKPMRNLTEVRLEDRLDHDLHRSLHHPVPYVGDAQGPFPAIRFLDVAPTYRTRPVRLGL